MTTRTTANSKGARPKNPPPRILRPCMTQPIRAAPTAANDYNNFGPGVPTPSWDVILSARSKTKSALSSSVDDVELEQFNSLLYEPHRVLGFLFSELKARLQKSLPDDKNVHKILSEIQQTMKRLAATANKAPLTASSCNLMQERRVKKRNSGCQTDKRISAFQAKESQTEVCFSGFERFLMEAQIKETNEKLEGNCDALEKACAALQEEKFSIHEELCRCRDEVSLLKTEVSHLQTQLKEATSREKCITQDLEDQCRHLQDELKRLQDFLSKQKDELAMVESLSRKLKESSEKINQLERSRLENDKILVFTQLEKEKLMILHKFRENQVETLQRDISEIYKLLKEQLAAINLGVKVSYYGDGDHKTTNHKNQKKTSHRKGKFDLSPTPRASGMDSSFENNLQPESFRNETKSRKMHRTESNTSRFSNSAPDVACDLFSKEAITLNDDYLERGGADKAGLSFPTPTRPKNQEGQYGEGRQRKVQERQETTGSDPSKAASALNMDVKKSHHRANEAPPLGFLYSGRSARDKKSGAHFHHPERWAAVVNEPSDFEEFKRLLDDVIPPSPPGPLKGFLTSSSTDASFDFSQENSSNG